MHTLRYPSLQTYARLNQIDMHDFRLRDLQTFYLPPYLGIMLKNSELYNSITLEGLLSTRLPRLVIVFNGPNYIF